MYTNGIVIGDNTYILSDEDGYLTLLSGYVTPEETEQYIKVKNNLEVEKEECINLQDKLQELYKLDKSSRKSAVEALLSVALLDGLFIMLGALNLELSSAIALLGFPIVTALLIYYRFNGTKKKRTKLKEEINAKLSMKKQNIKELENKMNQIKEKIEVETCLGGDEIIPVTTIGKGKKSIKMRILKLDSNENKGR